MKTHFINYINYIKEATNIYRVSTVKRAIVSYGKGYSTTFFVRENTLTQPLPASTLTPVYLTNPNPNPKPYKET